MSLGLQEIFRLGGHLFILESEIEALVNDDCTGIRVGIHIRRIVTEIHVTFFYGVYDHKCAQILHADSFVQEYMQETYGFVVCGEIPCGRQAVRGSFLSRIRRGRFRFFRCSSADLFQKLINLGSEGIHIGIQGFPVLHLFHLSS